MVGSPYVAPPPTYSSATQQTVPAGLFPPSQPSVMTSTAAHPVVTSQVQIGHTLPVYTHQSTAPSLYSNVLGQASQVNTGAPSFVPQPTGIAQTPITQPAQYHNCTFTVSDSAPRERNSKKIPSYDGTTNLEGYITNFSLLTKGL